MSIAKILAVLGSGLVLVSAYIGFILKDMPGATPYWLGGGALLAGWRLMKELEIKI